MKKCLIAVLVLFPLFLLAADPGTYKMNGTVGKREVAVECQLKGATLTGTMRNKENGKEFQLQGVVNAGGNAKIRVMEGGKPSGVLNGTLTASGFTGTWKAVEGSKEMPCKLAGNFIAAPAPPTEPPPASPSTPEPAPARPPVIRSSGLKNETIGGIRIFDDMSVVHSAYGKPQKSSSTKFQGEMTGEYTWNDSYSSKGIEFELVNNENSKAAGRVRAIRVFGNSKIFTSSGIGIGSPASDVEQAYGGGDGSYRYTEYDPPDEMCCGLSLEFKIVKGVVAEIKLYYFEE